MVKDTRTHPQVQKGANSRETSPTEANAPRILMPTSCIDALLNLSEDLHCTAMAETVIADELLENKRMEGTVADETCTHDGSVDWRGRPTVKGKSGGWTVATLLLVNQGLATLAFYGVGQDLVVFLTKVLQLDNADAANRVSTWTGTAYIFSLAGAFLSDSYWGRYKTCTIFQLIFVCGLVELSLSTCLLLLKPCIPGDENPKCAPPTDSEILVFYLSIYQIALGSGGYQPVVATFGADQFNEDDPEEGEWKIAFFSYFYMANNIGTLFSNTVLAYIEDKGKWVIGFWMSAGAAILAVVSFFAGTPKYRHFNPAGNFLTRLGQVIIATIKKWNLRVPECEDDLFEIDGQHSIINGGRKILHTPDFRFLDKAAIITSKDMEEHDQNCVNKQWSLCTVTQVEEVKCILRFLPIWLCSVIYSVVYNQMSSIFIVQGEAMKTSLSSFNIPPASMSVFEILSVTAAVLVYSLYVVPLLARMRKSDLKGRTELQRMGAGLVVSALAMISAGFVELKRLEYAKDGYDASNGSSSLSILWQIPQYVLIGVSEVLVYVGQLEFFNSQAPDGLKSFGSALYVASMSAGSYLSSLIVTIVMDISGRGEQIGWISENLNKGHLDKFYFLLAGLAIIDLFIFVACAKCYRCISFDRKSGNKRDAES